MKIRRYFFVWLAATAMMANSAKASEMLDISTSGGDETITLTVPDDSGHKVFLIENPDRLVVDVPALPGHPEVALPSSYDGALLKSVRYGRFDPKTSRFVFDLQAPIHVAKIHDEQDGDDIHLIINIKGAGDTTVEKPAPAPAKTTVKPAPAKADKKKKQKAAKNEKPMIVIDPGHGGVDPGTIGPGGAQEKDVVFAMAQAIKAKLLKTGHYRVMLTRNTDTFIRLRQRTEIARRAGASIFISIHADSAPDMDARGLSVYTLSEKASDVEAEALAARENKADVLAGVDLSDQRDDVAGILISLAQRETKNDSATLADLLVRNLDDKVKLLVNSHRFAGFAVLKAPDVPSVLIETGFLSHPQEEKLLKSGKYRDKVATGIQQGLDAYFKLQKKFDQ